MIAYTCSLVHAQEPESLAVENDRRSASVKEELMERGGL